MRGDEAEGRRRRSVQVPAGPNPRSKHLKGPARVVLEALTHRLRPEGRSLECQLT